MDDHFWMTQALKEAADAKRLGEVPIGCVIVRGEERIASAGNRREVDADPLAHAEILAIREAAAKLGDWRLVGCTLYVTLEPCSMCAGALVNSRVDRLVFGARDPKAGFCGSLGNLVQDSRLNHRLEIREGVMRAETAALLSEFFASLRRKR